MRPIALLASSPAWNDGLSLAPVNPNGPWAEERYIGSVSVRSLPVSAPEKQASAASRQCFEVEFDGTARGLCDADSPTTATEVESVLNARLARFDRWTYELGVASKTSDPKGVLEVARELVGYSLVLFDEAFGFVASSTLPEDAGSEALRTTIERGYATDVSAKHQREYRRLMLEHPEGFSTAFSEPSGETPVWSQPVRAGLSVCRLHVMGFLANDPGTLALIRTAAAALGPNLEQSGHSNPTQKPEADLVQELVTRPHDKDEVHDRLLLSGWTDDSPWVVVRVETLSASFPLLRWQLCGESFRSAVPNLHISVLNDGITAIAAWSPATRHVLDRVCRQEGVVLGISDPVESLEDAPSAHAQAIEAARIGRQKVLRHMVEGTVAYDECKGDLLLEALHAQAHRLATTPLCLEAVRTYDRRHAAGYEETVKAFLDNWGNKTATCRELGIHRTTLDYRLAHLRDIFGIDLDDRKLCKLLQLTLWSEGAGI
jgi:hypothetical protein